MSSTRRATATLALISLLGVVLLASLALGSVDLPVERVVTDFTGFDGSNEHLIVREIRLPRTRIGLVAGASLGLAGALLRAVTRIPLAEPGLLGINAGAALAVVAAIALIGINAPAGFLGFALAGAAAALVVVTLGSTGRSAALDVNGELHVINRRATCCRFHRVPDVGYCLTCPLIGEDELRARLEAEVAPALSSA